MDNEHTRTLKHKKKKILKYKFMVICLNIKRKLNLVKLYNYYLCKFNSNLRVKLLLSNIINDPILKNNLNLKKQFIIYFILNHSYFQSKIIFYYKRKIWQDIVTTTSTHLEKLEQWAIANSYLIKWLNYFFFVRLNLYNKIFTEKNIFLHEKILHLAANVNQIFSTLSLFEANSLVNQIKNVRFNKINKILLKTSLNYFLKRRLNLFKLTKVRKLQTKNKKTKIVDISAIQSNNIKRKDFYLKTAFLTIKLKSNNVFLTVLDYKGKTLYQCSGGFYDTKGQKRVNLHAISRLTRQMIVTMKRFYKIERLVILNKNGFTNKLIKSILYGLRTSQIDFVSLINTYNRPTTNLRKRKLRRV